LPLSKAEGFASNIRAKFSHPVSPARSADAVPLLRQEIDRGNTSKHLYTVLSSVLHPFCTTAYTAAQRHPATVLSTGRVLEESHAKTLIGHFRAHFAQKRANKICHISSIISVVICAIQSCRTPPIW
jgi:hypothetical protein